MTEASLPSPLRELPTQAIRSRLTVVFISFDSLSGPSPSIGHLPGSFVEKFMSAGTVPLEPRTSPRLKCHEVQKLVLWPSSQTFTFWAAVVTSFGPFVPPKFRLPF